MALIGPTPILTNAWLYSAMGIPVRKQLSLLPEPEAVPLIGPFSSTNGTIITTVD
jgi:hypothetical protein